MAVRKWGPQLLVNTSLTDTQRESGIARAGDGFVVVWTNQDTASGDGFSNAVMMQRFTASGAKTGAEILVNTTVANSQSLPVVTTLLNGTFAVAWLDQSAGPEIRYRRFDAEGNAIDANDILLAPGIGADEPHIAPINTGTLAGGFIIMARQSAGVQDINAQLFTAAGAPSGAVIAVANSANFERSPAAAALADGTLVFTWHDLGSGNIELRRFTQAGAALAVEQIVSSAADPQSGEPSIAALENGGFVIAWQDDTDRFPDTSGTAIRGRLYQGDGVSLGPDFVMNGLSDANQASPAITALRDGAFAVTYESNTVISGPLILGQVFNADGSRRGAEFQVSSEGPALNPVLAELADGRIAVAWDGNDGSGPGVSAQILDPRDGIVTGTAAAETLIGHDAYSDEISGLAGNDVMHGLKGDDTLYGGAGDDTAEGGRGDDTAFGGAGGDGLRGGSGEDDLFGEAGNDALAGAAGADLLDGGAGTDTADYRFSTGVTVALDFSVAATGDAAGDTFASIEKVLGSSTGADTIRGGAAADSLFGNGGADTLDGRGGNDKVNGGTGIDALAGGAGIDRFEFFAQSEGGDTIADFVLADDSIALLGSGFGGLAAGTLGAALFVARADNVAQNAAQRFIFNTASDTLWFDIDGNGTVGGGAGADAPVLVADLLTNVTMTHADILII